jgi:hypothetical protein
MQINLIHYNVDQLDSYESPMISHHVAGGSRNSLRVLDVSTQDLLFQIKMLNKINGTYEIKIKDGLVVEDYIFLPV